jgi:hypothetical protein
MRADVEDTVADRDPDTIRKEIDQAREQLASTVDVLVQRANPRRIANDAKARVIGFVTGVKTRVIGFVKRPAVTASLVGLGGFAMVLVVGKIKNRWTRR